MAAAEHDGAQDEFAEDMPAPGKAEILIGQTDTDPHTAVGRDDFEDHIEDGVVDGVRFELARLDNNNEKHSDHNPPQIVRKLSAELLADEIAPRFFTNGHRAIGEPALQAFDQATFGVLR